MRSMRVLIIGYGSIGERHACVIRKYFIGSTIAIVSPNNKLANYKSVHEVKNICEFDYYIISSPTDTHIDNLIFLDMKLKNKIIFVEKPLYDRAYNYKPSGYNKIFIGFCLRVHPILSIVKRITKRYHPYFVTIICGSYLPKWRPNGNYIKKYSAKRNGGGVLLDLSHEIDYATWLFGEFDTNKIAGFNGKISELQIESDDVASIITKTRKNTIINLHIDYFSKEAIRKMIIHTIKGTVSIDLISNTIRYSNINGSSKKWAIDIARNELFALMHQNILDYPLFTLYSKHNNRQLNYILPRITESKKLMEVICMIKNIKLNLNTLCVIGCRGGSKGVPNKNIASIAGKPLIAYTILQAIHSKLFNNIVLTTDSKAIAKVGQEWGAEVFFIRDKEMANDKSGKLPAIKDALRRSEAHYNRRFDVIFDLDATSPLRLVDDIKQAYNQFLRDDNDILVTVTPSKKSPYFNVVEKTTINGNSTISLVKKLDKPILRRQDSPECYDMNASIYIWKRDALLNNDTIFTSNTGMYVMPEERSIDIDTKLDFEFVEFILNKNGGGIT